MSAHLCLAARARPPAVDARRFDGVSMALHWASAVLVVAMIASSLAYSSAADAASAGRLLTVHRSTGVLLWSLTVLRLAWRFTAGRQPPLPAAMPSWQRRAAQCSVAALYAVLVVQPLTGFAQSIWRGKPFPLFGLDVPALVARDRSLVHLFEGVHTAGAWLLVALVGVHAIAALHHHFIEKDGVLRSMWPGGRE